MRFVLGLLSGLLGLLAGWFGLAMLVIGLAGPDRDGGIAMGAFFQIGPIGGLLGFIAGVWLFTRIGLRRPPTAPSAQAPLPSEAPATGPAPAEPAPERSRISRPFAAVVVIVAGTLAWWAWYELIRSPYLSHGFMTLELQFRLPTGMTLPANGTDVRVEVEEGSGFAMVSLPPMWHGHAGDRAVILARAALDRKTSRRVVHLTLPGVAEQVWPLDLATDPDPTPGFTPWRLPAGPSPAKIELNYRLSSDR